MKRLLLASTLCGAFLSPAIAQVHTDPSTGNVGIGTTSPQQKLSVDGYVQAHGLLPASHLLVRTNPNDSQTFQTQGSAGKWIFLNNDGGGYFGIGTASPSATLEISRSSSAQAANLSLSVGPGASSVGDGPSISFLHSGNERGYRIYESAVATHRGELRFASGNATAGYDDRIVFDTNGNVGIGTTSPQATLAVHRAITEGTPGGLNVRPVISLNAGFGGANVGMTQGSLGGSNSFELTTADASGAQATRLMLRGASDITDTEFFRGSKNASTLSMILKGDSGNVGIGTMNPTHKLAVNGTIKAKEVIVETTGWSDYVFADNYTLQPLAEVEAHIKTNKHLPGIPSAAQVAEQGVSVGDMQAKLLAKIEELTLHIIAQEKRIQQLEGR